MSETTSRVQVEQQLIMYAAGIGTWRYDIDRDVFRGDDLARHLLRLEQASEPCGLATLLESVHPESADNVRRYFSGEEDGTETRTIVFLLRAPGEIRFLTARARWLPNPDGSAGQLIGTVMDDTEHQLLQQDLRQRENWLQTLVNGVPQSFMYMDKDQHIVFANEIFLRNTNWVGKDVRGKHLSEIHGAKLYNSRTQYIDRALRGETVSYEAMGRKGDGMGFFHHEFKPNFDAHGNVLGIFATATDISDRHEIELKLEEKQQELVRSNQDLEQFAYVASHDLKAPLRAIEVLVQWLREDLKAYEDGDVQENLGLLEQRTRRLGRLLDDLLEYSRVGRKVGSIAEVDCAALVRDLTELMVVPEGMGVEVSRSLPTFTTYVTPLEQVFRNLIGNAIKHHPGPTGKIIVACEETDELYQFSIADDGAGIPQEYAERVFQMFQTLKPRDEVEGSGMGLAIVSRIVEWQGGRVWFVPGPGDRGTVFYFQWRKSAPESGLTSITEATACRLAEK
ncbi:MAG TPA: ATP-binding protein [Gammaproteobacteria bacterium]|jgi:PAS domain S-box-containing protein